jgi:DNA recombination protein RmuC
MDVGSFALGAGLVALAGAALLFLLRRGPVSAPALESLVQALDRIQSDVVRLASRQDELRLEVQRGREASLLKLAETTSGIRGELGQAQKTLAEVKALEQGRARQADVAADSLRRLEAVLAGSASRGLAGENLLARALLQLPPDLLEVNAAFGGKVVEYALRLPGGRLLPIDSKWTSVALLEQWEDASPGERKRLAEEIGRDVKAKTREMAKYLDPERTLALGLLAVPDAVHEAAPEALVEGFRQGVLVVPYSLALPYVLGIYRLAVRFGAGAASSELPARLRDLEEALRRAEEEVESRLSRALVQLGNSRDSLREHLSDARRNVDRLGATVETTAPD